MTRAPERVLKSAQMRSDRVRLAVDTAMGKIGEEIKNADGVYPFNSGRLTMAEVCRRAGIHPITLMGKAHRDTTRMKVQAWLTQLKSGVVTGARDIRKNVNRRAASAEDHYTRIAARFQAMYQVEIPRRDEEIRQLKSRVSELEEDHAKLQEQVSAGRVIRIPPRRG